MKKHYLLSCLMCLMGTIPTWAQTQTRNNNVSSMVEYSKANSDRMVYAEEEVDYEQLLACPDNTVQSVAFREGGYVTQTSVDANRSDMKSIFYQYYDGCRQTVNSIRLMASFATFDGEVWSQCFEHPSLDETGEVIKEIPLEIGFYEPGENGRPGKEIFQKTIAARGRFTQVYLGRYAVYEFEVDLKETISLYKGWFSVRAAENPNMVQTCWFSLLGSTYNTWPAYVYTASEPEEWQWVTPFSGSMFCLMGNGEFIAQRAVELQKVIAPLGSSSDRAQKVQLTVGNIGEQTIDEINLELWFDGKLLATEAIHESLNTGESYRYTFNQRIDCSDQKAHTLEIRNVTPGLEQIVEKSIFVELQPYDYPAVGSLYSHENSSFISSVEIGTISNKNTGNDSYHDYSDMKTDINMESILNLTIKVDGEYTPEGYGVWVDWNNNKSFNDENDLIILNNFDETTHTADVIIQIPENTELAVGDVRMRITACCIEDKPNYEGYYLWGETEDYTLTITRMENSPVLGIDKNYLDIKQNAGKKEDVVITLSNSGKRELKGDIAVEYVLPNSPNVKPVYEQLTAARKQAAPRLEKQMMTMMKAQAPQSDAEFILKYDNGQNSALGMIGYQETGYATYYPGEMLQHIEGMTIESVDVYIYDPAPVQKVVIYGQGTQNTTGEIISEQIFVPTAHEWNHVQLDKPVTIEKSDLWIGVKCENITEAIYPIGTDRGSAVDGYGGMINVGGNRWWSLPELGDNTNLCIRANINGTRTDAINWIAIDKTRFNIQTGNEDKITATVGADNLEEALLYEAVLKITSNDDITSKVKIPVYMAYVDPSGIVQKVAEGINVYCLNHQLTIDSEKEMAQVKVLNIAGQQMVQSDEHVVNLMNVNNGIYIVVIEFTDNSRACVKIIVE